MKKRILSLLLVLVLCVQMKESKTVTQNTELTIIEDLGDVYLCQHEETLCYLAVDMVSESQIVYYGGGGGGGGSNDWTAPML